MWPDLCPESGPSFWLGLVKYLKIPYLGRNLSLVVWATFWPRVWPQSGQISIQFFPIDKCMKFKYGSKLGPHSGHGSWPPPWLQRALWSPNLGSLWRAIRGGLRDSYGTARGGLVELFFGNDLERALEAIEPIPNGNMAQAQP